MDQIRHFERQVGNKCAIHAINNCLQYQHPLVGDDTFNKACVINIARIDDGMSGEKRKGYSMDSVLIILARLKLRVVQYSSPEDLKKVRSEVFMKTHTLDRDKRFIGVLGGGSRFHYVSVVPLRQVRDGEEECRWVLLDSLRHTPVLYSDSPVEFYWLLEICVR